LAARGGDRFVATIEGSERRVELEDGDGGLLVARVDGREYRLEARAIGEDTILLAEGAATRVAQVEGAAAKLTVELSHPDGEPRQVAVRIAAEDPRATTTSTTGAVAGPVTLRAPIPGKVVKQLVRVGETVIGGQPVIVLEAMKMENELRAPRPGTVAAIHAAEGSTVETGQELISIA